MMRLLLDTHILIGLVDDTTERFGLQISDALAAPDSERFCSVASLWEIAIKVRLGRLPLRATLTSLPSALGRMEIGVIPIDQHHVLANLDPEPLTRDPFDRLLLAQCQVEGLRLVTLDRSLAHHPLALQ